jgi:hypothetical protein
LSMISGAGLLSIILVWVCPLEYPSPILYQYCCQWRRLLKTLVYNNLYQPVPTCFVAKCNTFSKPFSDSKSVQRALGPIIWDGDFVRIGPWGVKE